jgi:hypothetical protein
MMSQRSLSQDLADILRHSLRLPFGRKSGPAPESAPDSAPASAPGTSEASAEPPVEAAQLGALALVELSKDAGIWSSPGKVDLDWALEEPADDDSLLDDLLLRAGASPEGAKDRGQLSADAAPGSLRTDPALDDILAPPPLAPKPQPMARGKVAHRRARGQAPLPSDPDLDDILSPDPPPKR